MTKSNKKNKEVIPIEEYNEKQKELLLTKQQKFNFDNNKYEDDKEIKKKKKNSVSIKMYLDLKRKFVKSEKEKNKYRNNFRFLCVVSIILFLMTLLFIYIHVTYEPKYIEKEKLIQDENIVFLGDSITDFYDLDKYYEGYNIVNSGISGNTTEDILNDMYNRVYKYNPSKVILLIGTNDINVKIEEDDTISNIKDIVKNIKKNRPNTKIYVESIYPINNTDDEKIEHYMVGVRTNEIIKKYNKRIKEYCNKNNVIYINMYNELRDEDGNLKLEYTKEGLHISDEGYEVITKILKKYIQRFK